MEICGFFELRLFRNDTDEIVRHERHCLAGDEDPAVYWGPEVAALVAKRIAEERRIRDYR